MFPLIWILDMLYSEIPLWICLWGWSAMHISKYQILTVYELQMLKVYSTFGVVTCVVFKVGSCALDMFQI